MPNDQQTPWEFLDEFRGKLFGGEWPTLPELFEITTQRYPNRPAFTVYEPARVSLTYQEALERIVQVAGFLHQQGVLHGDRVAVTGKNSPEWAIAYLAILYAGAIVVPIDYQLTDREVENLLRASDSKLLFVDEEKYDHFSEGKGEYNVPVQSLSPKKEGYIYDLSGALDETWQPAKVDELAAILFTSGTTGRPKGVMLTHKNFVADCFLAQYNLNIFHTDVFYALLPIHHSYCMLAVFIESFSVGAETVFGKRLAITQVLSDLKEAKVSMFLGVPMLFNKLINGIMHGIREKGAFVYGIIRGLMGISGTIKKLTGKNPGKRLFHSVLEKASLATVRICISGGGPLAPTVFRQYNQLGIDFVQGYGLTETAPILTLNPVEHYKEESVGRVLPEVDMQILDPDERGAGEIIVKGPMVMEGYYNMPEETAEVFTDNGYFRTGDVGYLDNDNYLYITGRAKNLIVSEGGKNVYPEEIENEFQTYSEIEQIMVRGYEEDATSRAEKIEALVYPNEEFFKTAGEEGAPASKEAVTHRVREIVSEVNQRLLPYQRISRTTFLEEPLEMTTTKKIKRHAVDQ
ncbi:MAG: AMP-dependent synthetase/ligase [Spirochaetaceae bacterium]